MCALTDPLLTTEIAPSFVPLTRVSHRNLRSTIYRYITPLTHADTHVICSLFKHALLHNNKVSVCISVLFHLLFTAAHSKQSDFGQTLNYGLGAFMLYWTSYVIVRAIARGGHWEAVQDYMYQSFV